MDAVTRVEARLPQWGGGPGLGASVVVKRGLLVVLAAGTGRTTHQRAQAVVGGSGVNPLTFEYRASSAGTWLSQLCSASISSVYTAA
jgi:hypothetical protein